MATSLQPLSPLAIPACNRKIKYEFQTLNLKNATEILYFKFVGEIINLVFPVVQKIVCDRRKAVHSPAHVKLSSSWKDVWLGHCKLGSPGFTCKKHILRESFVYKLHFLN